MSRRGTKRSCYILWQWTGQRWKKSKEISLDSDEAATGIIEDHAGRGDWVAVSPCNKAFRIRTRRV